MTPTEELDMAFRIRVAALVVALLALALFTSFAIVGTEGAMSARYVVTQCGWHVGQDADWADSSADRYVRSSYCQTPDSADPFDGVHLSSEVRASTTAIGGTRFARWRWQAPPGTGIVAVQGQRWQFLKEGFQHRIGSVASGGGFTPFLSLAQSDSVRRSFSSSFSPFAQAFESRLLCARPNDRQCAAGGTVLAGVRALNITLDDPARPSSQISGGLTGTGWLRGAQSLSFTDRDVGAGLRFAQTLVDGAVRASDEMGCSKVQITGQWRGKAMRPCPLSAAGAQAIDTRGLSDGPHQLRHCAVDFAGNEGCTPDRTILIDNDAPSAPRGLQVTGGDGWHRANGFELTWTDPDQGRASPILGNRLRLSGEHGYAGGPWNRFGSGLLSDIEVPAPGRYVARVWLVDSAGNANEGRSAEVTLRFDDVPPTAYFADPPPADPESITVPVADAHSGVAGGTISWRSGDGEWHELPSRYLSGSDASLSARLPADVPRGELALRAAVVDRAGNVTVTDRRANGSRVSVSAPLRHETTLVAGLSPGSGVARGILRVPYGKRALLTGRLLAAGGAAQGSEQVTVTETPYPGSRRPPVSWASTTDSRGEFSVWLPPGPGRRVRVGFAGTKLLSEAVSATLEMRVAGRLRFSVSPRRLATGRRARFRGRVVAAGAWQPRRGSLVQVQYYEEAARRWRPVILTRTDRDGRFRSGYRFRYITGVARIRLRARLVPSPRFPYAGAVSRPVVIRVRG